MKWTYDLVVLIDCWPSHYDLFACIDGKKPITEFYKRLVNKLKTIYRHPQSIIPPGMPGAIAETDSWLLDHINIRYPNSQKRKLLILL